MSSRRPATSRRVVGWCSSTRTASARSRRSAGASNPRRPTDLPWNELEDVDAVYFTAGDVAALREARRAKVLVATSRVSDLLAEADLHLDAVVGSGNDPSEAFDPARLTASTRPGRSDRQRPRRPVRDQRRPERLVRTRGHTRARRRHVRGRRLVRGRIDVRARRRPRGRGGALARRAVWGVVRRRSWAVREPARRVRPRDASSRSRPPSGGARGRPSMRRTTPVRAAGRRPAAPRGSSRARGA